MLYDLPQVPKLVSGRVRTPSLPSFRKNIPEALAEPDLHSAVTSRGSAPQGLKRRSCDSQGQHKGKRHFLPLHPRARLSRPVN